MRANSRAISAGGRTKSTQPRGDGAAGHAVVLGGGFILGEGNAALGLDLGQTEAAVAAGAGENHADGVRALGFGEGAHKEIDGQMLAADLAGGEVQGMVLNGHGGIGRNDVDVIGLDLHAILHFDDGHGCGAGDQLGEHAFVLGIEMLNEDESHSGVGREMGEKFGEGFQAAGRSSNGDNGHVVGLRRAFLAAGLHCDWL